MKIIKILGLFIVVVSLFFPSIKPAKADGGIYVPPDYYGYETSQQAFIYFAGQTETLVISAGFRGNAKDFSWVIPLPAKPEIDKASPQLFKTLAEITRPTIGNLSTSSGFGFSRPNSAQMPVEIISEKTVDMYNTAVLKASDEKSLSTWLADHGYNYPAGQDAALKSYVDSGWYFAVARIQPSLVNDPSTGRAMAHGDLTPLKFTFKTDKIIYPMKLTGVVLRSILPTDVADSPTDLPVGAQPEIVSTSMPLTLYVISAGKVEESSLTENYANWLLKNNLDEINTGLSGTQITGDKLFLTRLSATFVPDKITGDLTITSASNNSIIPAPVNKTADFWLTNALIFVVTILMLVLLLPGSIFIVSVVLQRFVRNKTVFIIASIYQILYCLLAILLWMLFISASGGSESFLSESGPLGVTAGMVLVLTAAIFFIIKMLRHYKKTFSPPA